MQYRSSLCETIWRSNFAGLWGLDDLEDPETAAVLRQAADAPDAFVLKPQREGGGNNLYGEAAREKIAARAGLAAYILMQRIRPPIHRCKSLGVYTALPRLLRVQCVPAGERMLFKSETLHQLEQET